MRCVANIVGSRVGKTDWGKGRNVETVEIVNRSGSYFLLSIPIIVQVLEGAQALVAITDTREVVVLTLPALEPLHTFQLVQHPTS